ncbi:hypothetical protein ACOME3_002326 [Neoechinorhynchus agilis]
MADWALWVQRWTQMEEEYARRKMLEALEQLGGLDNPSLSQMLTKGHCEQFGIKATPYLLDSISDFKMGKTMDLCRMINSSPEHVIASTLPFIEVTDNLLKLCDNSTMPPPPSTMPPPPSPCSAPAEIDQTTNPTSITSTASSTLGDEVPTTPKSPPKAKQSDDGYCDGSDSSPSPIPPRRLRTISA